MEFKLYSQRLAEKLEKSNEDYFEYNTLPAPVINHLTHILTHEIGEHSPEIKSSNLTPAHYTNFYEDIAIQVVENLGLSEFKKNQPYFREDEIGLYDVLGFIKKHSGEIIALDVLELIFRQIEQVLPKIIQLENDSHNPFTNSQHFKRSPATEVIELLNKRLRQHHFGYRFENGYLIRLDSEFIHSEAVQPALTLLNSPSFVKAHGLFIEAHHKLLKGELADSLVSANKSFEATLRIIIKAKGWNDPTPPVASKLVDECLSKGLIPSYLKTEIDSFRGLFSQGVPTIRNFKAGHAELPDENGKYLHGELTTHLCQYALNLAASHIVFLIECYKDSERS